VAPDLIFRLIAAVIKTDLTQMKDTISFKFPFIIPGVKACVKKTEGYSEVKV